MKKYSKSSPTFANLLLKKWLLEVGQARRKLLLMKFKQQLVGRNVRNSAVRKGLLQLSAHPVVCVNRVATLQTPKKHATCHLSSGSAPDTNNNGESIATLNADCRLKMTETNKKKKSESNKLEGENPNQIIWRYIHVNWHVRPKSTSRADERLRNRQIKRMRLKKKFGEIFGDSDIEDYGAYRKSPIFGSSRKKWKKNQDHGSDDARVRSQRACRTSSRSGSCNSSLFPDHLNVSTPAPTSCTDTCDSGTTGVEGIEENTAVTEESLPVERGITKGHLVEADSINESQNFTGIDDNEAVPGVEIILEKMRKPGNTSDRSSSDSTSFCVSNSCDKKCPPHSGGTQHTDDLKKEPVSSNDSTCCPLVTRDTDLKPSSSTDTKPNIYEPNMPACASNRLLGALDYIFLTLVCRRRVKERELGASKLALQRNQEEEVLLARHELQTKYIRVREEIRYLFQRLVTKDQVVNFISQGLDHRTPIGTEQFSKKEIDQAILEAEVQIPLLRPKTEFSTLRSEPTKLTEPISATTRVICTIDLTDTISSEDNDNVCDSSTDPPESLSANDMSNLPCISQVTTISAKEFETIEDEYPCKICFRRSLVACARCIRAYYCSKNCQQLHWVQSHHAKCEPYTGEISVNDILSTPIQHSYLVN